MIAARLPAVRPLLPRLPARLRRILTALAWGARWLALGLALGAVTDLLVRALV